jgi:hypothetical protein
MVAAKLSHAIAADPRKLAPHFARAYGVGRRRGQREDLLIFVERFHVSTGNPLNIGAAILHGVLSVSSQLNEDSEKATHQIFTPE